MYIYIYECISTYLYMDPFVILGFKMGALQWIDLVGAAPRSPRSGDLISRLGNGPYRVSYGSLWGLMGDTKWSC